MNRNRRIILITSFCSLFLWTAIGFAQIKAEASIDKKNIEIGDQFQIKLKVSNLTHELLQYDLSSHVFGDSIDVVNRVIDTVLIGNKLNYIEQTYTLTAFEEGVCSTDSLRIDYLIPNDTAVYSLFLPKMSILVSSIKVDTTKAIYDIKEIVKEPITFKEILPYLLILVAVLIVVGLGIYFYKRYKNNKPLIPIKTKPKKPAYLMALDAFEELRLKRLWQNNFTKEYYTELTDILREYIHETMNIQCIEMTSDQLLEALEKQNTISNTSIKKLMEILQISDLVKFAKMEPMTDEHDKCLKYGVDFVNETKPIGEEKNEEVNNNNTSVVVE